MKIRTQLIILISAICFNVILASTDKVFCYYSSWAYYRNGDGQYTVEDIDTSLCTHILYAFAGIATNGSITILDSWLDGDLGNLKKFTQLKEKNPELKALISIGGWNEGSTTFSEAAADATKRSTFISSVLTYVKTYNFDGIDIDWEYPAQRGGSADDVENYVQLLEEIRESFDENNLLLTAAVEASGINISYNVPLLSKYLDYINVMTYDFHGSWDTVTGEDAPLYASEEDKTDGNGLLNVNYAISEWLQSGADPNKLILGIPVYGVSFTLSDTSQHGIGAPVSGPGNVGPYTESSGTLGYNEICKEQLNGTWTVVWDDGEKVSYAYKGNQWVGFDDPKSVEIKVNFAKSLKLGGVMIWSLDTDDFKGGCGQAYPILTTINSVLGRLNGSTSQSSSAKPQPTTTTKAQSSSSAKPTPTSTSKTTPAPSAPNSSSSDSKISDICTQSGYVRDENDCSVFYYCLQVGNNFVALKQTCTSGLVFDIVDLVCNYADLVKC